MPYALQFLRHSLSQNEPLILSASAVTILHWPVTTLWTSTSYFLNTLSSSIVSLHLTPTGQADSLTLEASIRQTASPPKLGLWTHALEQFGVGNRMILFLDLTRSLNVAVIFPRASLAGLQDHLQLAREYALEGLYDTSVIFFDGAIALITKHLSSLDDPLLRSKWMNVKKALSEETEVVKQLDSEKRSFKDTSMGRRPSSPPISTNKSSFVFEPQDEYPTSSNAPMDDHDPEVWRPPNRDTSNRISARARVGGTKKSPQDGAWARGSTTTRGGPPSRGWF